MVFDRWRRRAPQGVERRPSFDGLRGASRDARLSTGYERAIDSLKTSEKGGFHEVDGAPCRTCAASCARALSRQLR